MTEPTPAPDGAAMWRDEVAFAERLQLEASLEYTSKPRMRQIALTALRNYLALAEMFMRANEAAVEAMKAQESSLIVPAESGLIVPS